ncbi:MAG: DivIVA domain-containing protein [Clostridia bacterium]|nr:DivIVA domain-containing protein [Clostridia bacterium]
MLTTDQILNAMFTPVSKGAYSADEVDSFLKSVAESYEQSLQDNKELIKKISILADKIESYRNDEEAIKLALLDARRLAETINKDAAVKAEATVADAENKSKIILDGATRQSNQMIDEAREKAKEIVDNARVAVASLTNRAQNETEQAITSAQQKATEIVLKAEAQGRDIIGRSKADYEYYSCEVERLKKEIEVYKQTTEKLCKDQLALLDGVAADAPEVYPVTLEEPPVPEEFIIEEDAEVIAEELASAVAAVEIPDAEEIEAAAEEIEDATEEEIVAEEIPEVLEVPEFEDIEIDEADEATAKPEEDDDIFSMIEELNFDDIIAPEEIPATLEEAVAEAEKEETEIEEDEDDEFEGFKIDLDELDDITSDAGAEEDITSLFDSFFNE